jgi:phosphoadenosine phosphosulfate reductase
MQPHWKGLDTTAKINMTDIEARFRINSGVDYIAYGWRRSDSMSRAMIMKKCAGLDNKARRVFPLRAWKRSDVYAYLDMRGIMLPPGLGRKEQGGLDFNPGALAWLRENYPDDWEKWRREFPFSEAQIAIGADR